MNNLAVINVLDILHLYRNCNWFTLNELKKHVIRFCKDQRKQKGLTLKEAAELGLNIYEKKEPSIDSIVTYLINEGFVQLEENKIDMTEQGEDLLLRTYTDNYSKEFLSYKNQLAKILKKRNEPDFEDHLIARHYWNNLTIDEIKDIYFDYDSKNSLGYKSKKIHQELLELQELKITADSFIFHVMPTIFLPFEDLGEKVNLKIEGIEEIPALYIGKPYPNKRYSIAGIKARGENKYSGFYALVASKDSFPVEQNIRMHWFIGNYKEVIHDLKVTFKFERGNLFSTKQFIDRSCNIKKKIICAYASLEDFDEFSDLSLGKEVTIDLDNQKEIFHIEQKVELTSFPMHMHSIR